MKLDRSIEKEPLATVANQRRRKRKTVIKFLLSFGIGAAIFLTTNNTIAGTVLPSIHAAWGPLRTGWWTFRADYRRLRAVICFAFYLATACWHAAAAAFGSVLLFVVLAMLFGDEPTMDVFAATMLMLVIGLVFATIVGLAASTAAAITSVRLWVNPKLRDMVDGDLARVIELPADPGFNHAVFVLATSLALPVLAASGYLIAVVIAGWLTLAVLTVGPLLALTSYFWLSSRIIATHPAECWKS